MRRRQHQGLALDLGGPLCGERLYVVPLKEQASSPAAFALPRNTLVTNDSTL